MIDLQNESGTVKGDVTIKGQSVNPIQSKEASDRAASEQITAQPETTLTYRTTTCQLQVYKTTATRFTPLSP